MEKRNNWNWKKNEKDFWLRPVTHSAYLGQRWLCDGKNTILDIGCGLVEIQFILQNNMGLG